ncbi:hypothetical protein J6590_085088 [Homalodisca vitripennis]|nr:hypothetical protein J6590_085088 [Homalodisca vitripennis]
MGSSRNSLESTPLPVPSLNHTWGVRAVVSGLLHWWVKEFVAYSVNELVRWDNLSFVLSELVCDVLLLDIHQVVQNSIHQFDCAREGCQLEGMNQPEVKPPG